MTQREFRKLKRIEARIENLKTGEPSKCVELLAKFITWFVMTCGLTLCVALIGLIVYLFITYFGVATSVFLGVFVIGTYCLLLVSDAKVSIKNGKYLKKLEEQKAFLEKRY